jgi:hypothetical protein
MGGRRFLVLKKLVSLILVLLFVGMGVFAKEEGDEEGVVDFCLRLEPGQNYRVRIASEQNIIQTIEEVLMEIPQYTEMVYKEEVLEVDAEGNAYIRFIYESVVMKFGGTMGIYFDSNEPSMPDESPVILGLRGLIGQSFIAKLSPDGHILDIQGTDLMIEAMLGEMKLPEGAMLEELRKIFQELCGEDALKESLKQLTGPYPPCPARVGDQWVKHDETEYEFTLLFDTTYKLAERLQDRLTIEFNGMVKVDPEQDPFVSGSIGFRYDLAGEQSGWLEMRESTGWIEHGHVELDLKGRVFVEEGPEGIRGMSWPIQLTGWTTVETTEVKDEDKAA